MPRYDYECEKCGPFEAVQSMRDEPLQFHDCGAPAVRKIAQVSFALKGGGWYADGYGASKATGTESGASKTASTGDTKAPSTGTGAPSTATPAKVEAPPPKPAGA